MGSRDDTYNMKCIVTIYFLISCIYGAAYGQDCVQRNYGTEEIVCVCNDTYCDSFQSPEQLLQPAHFLQYTTSKSGRRLDPVDLEITNTVPANGTGWEVDLSTTYQEMLGFGGAMTDAAGINIETLTQETRERLLRQYFGSEGIGYTFIRVPMGGTDFSTRFYTYDDGDADETLSNFSLADEDLTYKIPYMRYARELVPDVRVFACPWSPPLWMVESRNGTEGFTRLKDEYYPVLAQYFLKFLQAYKANGIDVWGVSTQNEAGDGYYAYFGINSCGYSPEEERNFIANNLGPTLRNSEFSNITIMITEDQRSQMPDWAEVILGDDTAYEYVNGTAIHWYYDDGYPSTRLSTLHDDYPEKFIFNTEASFLGVPGLPPITLGNWSRAEILLSDMIDDFNHWVTGWVDWNIALDPFGEPTYLHNNLDSPIIVNMTANEFYKQPIFYSMAHFSKFVLPGSKRVQLTSNSDTDLESVAFLRPDNVIVVVLLNRYDGDENIVLKAGTNDYLPISVPAHSLNTVLFNNNY